MTVLSFDQTLCNAKACLLALFDVIERLELDLLITAPIDPDTSCGYIPTPKALAYLASIETAPSADGLAGGGLPSSQAPPPGDEGGGSSFLTPPPVGSQGAGRGDPRIIRTQGGNITVQDGEIVNAWCANCKRGGLPLRRDGRLYCICGHLIADTADLAEEIV